MNINQIILSALNDMKAENIKEYKNNTNISDYVIIASGISSIHLKSMLNHVIKMTKVNKIRISRIEGYKYAEWIIVDLNDIILHIIQHVVREYYLLDNLYTYDN
jgi:ribosome-associated protein